MSEEKTKADQILDEMSQLRASYQKGEKDLATVLKLLTQKSDEFQAAMKTETQPKHTHHSAEIEFDCPECKSLYDKKIIKEYRDTLKGLKEPVICKDCGEIVEKEAEECPTCHGRKANKIK